MDNASDKLSEVIKRLEPEIYREIIKVFDTLNVSAGALSNTEKAEAFLMNLDNRILAKLQKSGYYDAVGKFTKDFGLVADNIKEVQSFYNGQNILSSQIDPIKRLEVANTVDRLLGTGLSKDFVNPIRQTLYRNILFGSTITETQKTLRDFIISKEGEDSRLLRYVKQVSRDSISQFDGSVQQAIGIELGLDGKRYVGSLLKDSRAQCNKWVAMKIIPLDILQAEIDWALGKGDYKGKRCSGMIEETNVNTFDIYRGGYNCRHRSIPTKIKK